MVIGCLSTRIVPNENACAWLRPGVLRYEFCEVHVLQDGCGSLEGVYLHFGKKYKVANLKGTNMKNHRLLSCTCSVLIAVVLSGCASPGLRAARNECSGDAYSTYPISNYQTVVMERKSVEVPTGQTNCTTTYMGTIASTNCQQVTRWESREFPKTVVEDRNESARKNYIAECARRICMRSYGNGACES